MANIKSIVKVMNFQALLHVDSAHRAADKYLLLEKDVSRMIDIIENNQNLILDKKVIDVNSSPNAPRLRIYIGSDLGFCGIINASVNRQLEKENGNNDLVIIGKKIHTNQTPIIEMARDEFDNKFSEITTIFENAINNKTYSGIDIFYNHYHNMSHIEPIMKTIFPIEIEKDIGEKKDIGLYTDDFFIEGGNPEKLLRELTVTYLNFEMQTAIISSYASENILRQQATNESLKHIDEMETEKKWQEHKEREATSVSRIIDSYTKLRYRG